MKKKYLIRVNTGGEDETFIVEADNIHEARELAYAKWREAVEQDADYGVVGEINERIEL